MKQLIIIRKDLKMRKGKMVAQGAHASMKAILDMSEHLIYYNNPYDYMGIPLIPQIKEWLEHRFTKVTVSAKSEAELLDLYKQAQDANLICSLIQDAGLTEFDGVPTYTAVAIGPGHNNDIDKITGNLPLL